MAKRLGISKSHYEILESPQLVPDPLPVHIADRLNAMRQMAAGHFRKMPRMHCLQHPDYWLRRHRGDWLPPLRGKKRRWWAYCPSEGDLGKFSEIYIVPIDGVIRKAPSFAPRRKKMELGGRPPIAKNEMRQNFRIGDKVERKQQDTYVRFIEVKKALPKRTRAKKNLLRRELAAAGFSNEEIEAGLSARTAKEAARNFVAAAHNLQFSTVGKYHREYLKSQPAKKRKGLPIG